MLKNKLIAVMSLLVFFAGTGAEEKGYQVGDKARDFKLKNVDGQMVSLSDYQSVEGYVVIFTCNSCPVSKLYENRIIALDKKYKKKGFPVIAINPNDVKRQPGDSYEKMQERAKKKGFTFPYLYDETQEIAKAYGATNTPHVYLLDKDRVVKYIGAIDNNSQSAADADQMYVEDAMNAMLAGKSIENTKTKAIGCTIKWKSV